MQNKITDKDLLDLANAYAIGADISFLTQEDFNQMQYLLLVNPREYVVFCLAILEGQIYELEPVQTLIIDTIADLFKGKYKVPRLIINVPPGIGKTSISVWGILSWIYSIEPTAKNLHISRTLDLVNDNSNKIRKIVESEQHQKIFGVKLSKNTNAKSLWETEQGGAFRAVTSHGGITGFRAGRIRDGSDINGVMLIDDANKPSDVFSYKTISTVNDLWDSTFRSRRASSTKTPVIVIMQRIGESDFTDHLLNHSGEEWMHLVVPVFVGYKDSKGNKWTYEENGIYIEHDLPFGSIFPKKFDDNEAYSLMTDVQYSQKSHSIEGEVFDNVWILETDDLPRMKEYHIKVDTATKTNEWNDYSVFSLFGKGFDNKAYHIDIERDKIKVPYLYDRLKIFILKSLAYVNSVEDTERNSNFSFSFKDDRYSKRCKIKVAVEDKDSGQGLNQTIEDFAGLDDTLKDVSFIKVGRREGKYARALRASPKVKDGTYIINSKLELKGVIKNEFQRFKSDDSHSHDDIIDTVFDMLNYEIPSMSVMSYATSSTAPKPRFNGY